jgi:hypothetical protein
LSFSKNPVLKFFRKNAQKRCVPENSREKNMKIPPSSRAPMPPRLRRVVMESGQSGAAAPAASWQTSGDAQKQRENAKNRAPRMRQVFLTRLTQF